MTIVPRLESCASSSDKSHGHASCISAALTHERAKHKVPKHTAEAPDISGRHGAVMLGRGDSSAQRSAALATRMTTAQFLKAAPARTPEPHAHVVHISGSDARASQNAKYPNAEAPDISGRHGAVMRERATAQRSGQQHSPLEVTTAQYLKAAPARTPEPHAHVVHISGSDARASQNTKYPNTLLKPLTSLADMAQ